MRAENDRAIGRCWQAACPYPLPSFRYGLAESSDRDVIDRLKYRQGLLHAAPPACWQTGLPSPSTEELGLRNFERHRNAWVLQSAGPAI